MIFNFGKKGKSTPAVRTDSEKIAAILERGVERHYPNDAFLKERLESGERLRLYLGIDPTGPTLHLGHAIPLRKLKQFQELGHEIILLIGDFTARIGDPDKKDVRKQLTHDEVLKNATLYKEQASAFITFDGPNPAKLMFNHDWLSALTFADVVELASKVTVQQMLERDMFKRRIQEERPIYVHEFMYPLMQGYDAVAMEVDGEVGGNDQTFNMLTGRTLLKEMKNKEKFVIPMKLLVDTAGEKMGKTTGNMLSFLDTPDDKFGKVMSWTDGMIRIGFELCTDVALADVDARLTSDENPRDIKLDLAEEIVATYHGSDVARNARESFITAFQNQGTPEDIPEVSGVGDMLADVLTGAGIVSSKTDFKRLVEAGAITHKDTGEKVDDPQARAQSGTYKVGKHRFITIV